MLNVGGGGPHQGPLVRGLKIAFNKCPPLLKRNQWLQWLQSVRPLSAPPKRLPVGHGSKKMPGARLVR